MVLLSSSTDVSSYARTSGHVRPNKLARCICEWATVASGNTDGEPEMNEREDKRVLG